MKTNANDTCAIVREKILSGTYMPSQSLTEAQLASELKVSRTTVKKLLLQLERENLVTIEDNKGAKVRSYSLEEILELLDVRIALESYVVGAALPFITEKDISRMEDILKAMKQCIDNRQLIQYSEKNQVFHRIIYDACTNKTAVNMVCTIKNQISRYDLKTILIPSRDGQSFSEHSMLVDAIKRKDVEEAKRLLCTHVSNIKKVLVEYRSILL